MISTDTDRFAEGVREWLAEIYARKFRYTIRLLSRSKGSEIYEIEIDAAFGEHSRSLIMRRIISSDWISRHPNLARNEFNALRAAAPLRIATPEPIAVDVGVFRTGAPSVLMSKIEGDPWMARRAPSSTALRRLATALREIHASDVPSDALRALDRYAPHHWPAIAFEPPPVWTKHPNVWRRAAELACEEFAKLQSFHQGLTHRDYRLENVLWDGDEPVGVVDWVTACQGPPSADIGHCRWNLWRVYGEEAARAFSEAYQPAAAHNPLWDLLAAIGGMLDTPPTNEQEAENLDQFVCRALAALGAQAR